MLLAASLILASLPKAPKPRLLTTDDLRGLTWRSVGPANMGGRASDLCFVPGHPKTFFAAFGTSGLWKTANQGTTFTSLWENQSTSSIGSVVAVNAPENWAGWKEDKLAPKDSKEREKQGIGKIVWVGTGEGNGRNSSSWGDGVYRSTDGGVTFKHLGLEDSKDIPRLAVDPRNPDVCYAAALGHLWGPNKERGIYKTTDGGKTWKPVLQIDNQTGAIDVLLDPSHPDTLFAAMYYRHRTAYSFESGGEKGGIFRSTDGGNHWSQLTKGLPKQTGRIGLDLCRSNPKIVYAVVESDEGGARNLDDARSRRGGLFRSEDGGDSWTRVNAQDPRAFYFSKVRVDPKDPDRVFMIGYSIWLSEDGGKTFESGRDKNLHGDWHAFAFDPDDSEHLIAGSDGGIYQSFDMGKTWDFMSQMALGEFYNVATDNGNPYRLMGGLQDNGSWLGPSQTRVGDGNGITLGDWISVGGGDGFHCAFDPTDPNVVYTESQGGALGRINLADGSYKNLHPDVKEGQPALRFNWNTPFLVSPHDPTVLWIGGNRVFKLTQRGNEVEPVSPDLSHNDPARILTVGSNAETHGTVVALAESPARKNLLWAGTDDGRVHVTDDPDSGKWREVTPKAVAGHYIAGVAPSHANPDVAYLAVDAHRDDDYDPIILRTADRGRSWQNVTGDLPKGASVRVVIEDAHSPNVLFAGTETAAYVSIDTGAHWVKLNMGSLPTVAVHDLAQPSGALDGDLVAATHGRSLWVLDDAGPLSQLSSKVDESPLFLFESRPVKPSQRLGRDGLWGDKWYAAANPPTNPTITYWLKEAGAGVTIKLTDAKGKLVITLTGGGSAGMNRVSWDMFPPAEKRLQNRGEEGISFVPAGTYTVTLTQPDGNGGERTATGKLTILPYTVNTDAPIPPVSKGGRENDGD
jgi:photosystem II stability/assembly factor-like uncharacterized protein